MPTLALARHRFGPRVSGVHAEPLNRVGGERYRSHVPEHAKGTILVTIRNHIRKNQQGEGEAWVNLVDVLDWLQEAPAHANDPAATGAALEIRQMLLQQFSDAVDQHLGE